MKSLSVCQPFAALIISGRKSIELRNWNTTFRGEFLVHAPLNIRVQDCHRLGLTKPYTTGAIVGVAELYGVKRYSSQSMVHSDQEFHLASAGYRAKYGFLLRHARQLRIPIPYKGRLGFFDVDLPPAQGDAEIRTEIIEEEYTHQWIGRH